LSRFLNVSVICFIVLGSLSKASFEITLIVFLASALISCCLNPLLMIAVSKKRLSHQGMIPIAELYPQSFAYGQRCFAARLLSLIFIIKSIQLGSGLPYAVMEYILLEYYIYQIRIFNSICLDIFEEKFL
jgi:hypothetical protein